MKNVFDTAIMTVLESRERKRTRFSSSSFRASFRRLSRRKNLSRSLSDASSTSSQSTSSRKSRSFNTSFKDIFCFGWNVSSLIVNNGIPYCENAHSSSFKMECFVKFSVFEITSKFDHSESINKTHQISLFPTLTVVKVQSRCWVNLGQNDTKGPLSKINYWVFTDFKNSEIS